MPAVQTLPKFREKTARERDEKSEMGGERGGRGRKKRRTRLAENGLAESGFRSIFQIRPKTGWLKLVSTVSEAGVPEDGGRV